MSVKTRLILELGCNHNGVMDNAKRMIDDAVKLGAWGIKFQKRDPESMSQGEKLIPRKPENSFGANYYEHRKALEFSLEQLCILRDYALKCKLIPIVSVFDMVSLNQVVRAKFEGIKLPSQFYSHYALNKTLETYQSCIPIKVIVSTGMHTLNEVLNWQYFDCFDITMYCRSIYPFELKDFDFDYATTLKGRLKNSVFGYSSHDKDGQAIFYSVLIGARYIERHYTLDKNMKGSDHKTVSSDFLEMQKIIQDIERAEELLYATSNVDELFSEKEKAVRMTYRGF